MKGCCLKSVCVCVCVGGGGVKEGLLGKGAV